MTFYRYLGSHWMETLNDSRFKMAAVDDFNDPFDGRGRCVGVPGLEATESFIRESNIPGFWKRSPPLAAAAYTNELNHQVQSRALFAEMKVLCFSACEDNDPAQKLMWSHYAKGHRGVRVGLQLDDPHFPLYFDSVKYCHERPALDLGKVKSALKDEEILRFWISALTTKSVEWSYEREYRIISDEQHLSVGKDANGVDAWFWRFDPAILKSIDVGCMMQQSEIDAIISLVKEKRIGAQIRRVVLNQSNYDIAYETIYNVNERKL